MSIRTSRLAAFAVCTLLACSDSTAPPPQEVSLEEALEELNTVGTYAGAGLVAAGVGAPLEAVSTPAVCPLDPATMYFICPEHTFNGRTSSYRYQLLDAGGSPLPAFDPALVSGIHSIVEVSGTLEVQGPSTSGTITVDLHDERTMTGLGTATRVVNGVGTSQYTFAMDDVPPHTVSSTRTISNLVLPSGPGPRRYPASGSITTTTMTGHNTLVSTMTFNGSSTVTIVTKVDGTTMRTCTYDLATPMTAPVCD